MLTSERTSKLSKRALRMAMRLTVAVTAGATVLAAAPAGASTNAPRPTPSVSAASGAALQGGLGGLAPQKRIPAQHASTSAQSLAVSGGATAFAAVPASVDLSQWAPTAGYQGPIGSCVTWAIDYGMLSWYANHAGRAGAPFAPMYTYSQIKLPGKDGGSYPTTALGIALSQGNDTHADYYQGDLDQNTLPTTAERANAAHFKIAGWHTVYDANTTNSADRIALLKQELAKNHPVAVGIHLFSTFSYANVTAAHPYYDGTGTSLGYHEVMALGYDSYGLYIQNSWGLTFGVNGRFHMAWAAVGRDIGEAEVIDGGFAAGTTVTDATPPTMSAVGRSIAAGYSVGSTVPVTLNWSASDASGIAGYSVWTSTNGGTWADTTSRLTTATSKSVTLALAPGNTYRFAVAAQDAHGNWSPYSFTSTFSTRIYDDNSYVSYSTGWTRSAWASAVGGNEVDSATAGATASFTFTGTGVAWVAPMASNRGQAYVYVDGAYVMTVDLSSATVKAHIAAFSRTYSASGTHTVTIKVVGTSGRPTITVDAFALMG